MSEQAALPEYLTPPPRLPRRMPKNPNSVIEDCYQALGVHSENFPQADSQYSVGERSTVRLRFFEAEEVKVAAGVAGDDDIECIGKDAATPPAIAGEGSQDFSSLQVP